MMLLLKHAHRVSRLHTRRGEKTVFNLFFSLDFIFFPVSDKRPVDEHEANAMSSFLLV